MGSDQGVQEEKGKRGSYWYRGGEIVLEACLVMIDDWERADTRMDEDG